ncbi:MULTISPECIES: hypothetical protein [unclassified Exiguobacterium]|uniref:hypothetical protein n=1 Tax=unclassified Exiguobacterium TaxID=2644629 RepID=UPI000512E9C2|nr:MULTISPECIES: hypothetical protein [unclassified Exiguobacterium]KGI84893.1 hypothetical protein JY98_01175 [Exiguobacterium mexicanum]
MIKQWLFALSRITIASLAFYLGNLSTVDPVQISGNGNPALLFIPILLLLALFIMNDWIKVMKFFNSNSRILLPLLFIIGIALFFIYEQQVDNYHERKEYVQQVVIEREYKITDPLFLERVTGITYTYMSNQLFNLNTFVIYILLTLAMAIMYVLWTRRRSPISSPSSSK